MMFSELGDFGYKRTATQAIGFYFAYLLLIMVLGALSGFAVVLVAGADSSALIDRGIGIGAIIGALVCTFICYLILKQKGALKKFSSIVYVVASLGLGLLGGGIFGLIIPAYLTTRGSSQ